MAAEFYTAGFKRRNRLMAAVLTIAAGAAPFLIVLAVIQMWADPPGYALGVMTAAAFVMAALAPWYAHGSLALLGNHGLRQRLASAVSERTEASLVSLGAVFVGFSPGERLRIWDGETDRDVGFLYIRGGTLVYRGDEFDWSLPLSQIDDVQMTPPVAGMQRIVVHWHRPRSQSRSMSLVCREANTIEDAGRATRRLYTALRDAVYTGAQRGDRDRSVFCGYPPINTSGSWAVEDPVRGSCLAVLGMGVIIVLSAWRVAAELMDMGLYYVAILWAGLIAVVGTIFTSYLLNYMHAWEAVRDSGDAADSREA